MTSFGGEQALRVDALQVVGQDDPAVLLPDPEVALRLVTCWPLDGVTRSPWRYVASCAKTVTAPGPGAPPPPGTPRGRS